MYAQFTLSTMREFWIGKYCATAEFEACARRAAMACGEAVSPTLLPNGKDLARPLET
jgi:hypothetical protein